MTQKELLYFEDAIGHETNIIKIIENNVNNLQDSSLKLFMQNELSNHIKLKTSLINKLEEKSNE